MSKTKVAVLFGGQSSEHDVSCVSAATVINSIDRDYYDVVMVGITKDGRWLKTESVDKITDGSWRDGKVSMILSPDRTHKGFVAIENGKCKAEPVDVVFPVLHGLYGEDGTVQGILELVRGQIGQVQGIQLLGKAAVRHLGHHERSRLCLELLQQVYNLAQRNLVGHGNTAVATVCFQNSLHTVKFTVLLLAFQQVKHSLYQIVDVQQFQLGTAVVDSEWLVIGDCPAEGTDGTVVLRAAVSHQVHETVNRNLSPNLLSILEEQLLASLLAAAVLAVAEASSHGSLNGGGQHDGCLVVVLFQAVQQVRCKAEVALHEVFRVLRAIHACQIEHEVCFLAVFVQLRRSGVQIILEDFFNIQRRVGLIFSIPDVFQVVAQGGSHHALGTCD